MGVKRTCCIWLGLGAASYLVRWYFIGRLYNSKRKFESRELIVVTGATSGIGLAVVVDLLSRGCHVVIGSHSLATGRIIGNQLHEQHPSAHVDVFELKLESLDSVVEFSEKVRGLGKPVYALVNNAGVFYAPPSLTSDGIEYTYQVNYLAPFLLTLRLLPLLKQLQGDTRIVNVVSQAHRAIAEAPTDSNYYTAPFQDTGSARFWAYQYSKLCLVAFSHRLSQLLATGAAVDGGLSVHCVDPGNVETAIFRHFPPLANRVAFLLQKPVRLLLVKTPFEGAQGVLYSLLSEQKPPFYLRRFWGPSSSDIGDVNPLVYNPSFSNALWIRSRRQCRHHLLEMIV
ncbi:uncharacterized protein LOC131211362 [Anopheles bellator]|uniref:uncharacterized protein LOC131211362 n=1 Tax=Anopheles bellator TaxID=139047 RepID=UPI002647BD2B|nr:uncharacterized protein LOC131211362 [Anopheles bellator]